MKYIYAIVDGVSGFINNLPWMKEKAGSGTALDGVEIFLIAIGLIVIIIELLILAIICIIPAIVGLILSIPFLIYLSKIKKGTIISAFFILYYFICPRFIYNLSTAKGITGFIITTLIIAFCIHHVSSIFLKKDIDEYFAELQSQKGLDTHSSEVQSQKGLDTRSSKVQSQKTVNLNNNKLILTRKSTSSDWDDLGDLEGDDVWIDYDSLAVAKDLKQAKKGPQKQTSVKNKEHKISKIIKNFKGSPKKKEVYGPLTVINIIYTVIVLILVGISAYVWNVHSIGEFQAHKSIPNYMSIINALKEGTPPIALFYAIFGGVFVSRHVSHIENLFKSSKKTWIIIGKARAFFLNFLGMIWAAPLVSNTFYAIKSLDYDKGVDTNLLTIPLNILHDPFWNEHFILNVIVTATLMVTMFILLLFFYVYAFTYFPNFLVMIICCVFISRLSIMPGLSLLPIVAMSTLFDFTSKFFSKQFDYILIDIIDYMGWK